MSGYQDRLQGTDRLLRIRRIRKAVFAGLLALTIVLIFARLEGEGASLKPLFLPVNGILEVALIMGLTASIVGLFLRNLELRNVLRDNQRFLMAKSSMTRAIRTAAFAIGLAVALLLAITPSLAATLLSDPPQVVWLPPSASEVVTFTSPDPLGLTFVTYAAVGVTSGSVSVMVKRDNVTVAAPQTLTSTQRAVLDIEPSMWADHATWSLVFRNTQNASTFLTFVLQKGIVPTLFSTVPFLVFLYGAVQIGWWVVLRPIRERTKVTSLRSAAEIDSGERLYDPSAPIPDAPIVARADRMTSSFVDPPPPSPSAPPPPPRPAPVVRTPKAEPPRPGPHAPAREPETADGLVRKAEALVATGTYEAALTGFEEALRLDPDYVPALRGKATCEERLNQRSEALETHRRILANDRRNVDSLRAIARLQMADRRWRECLEAVVDLLRVRPNDAAALEIEGDALSNLGRRPEALAAYEAAAAVDPTDENLRQKIEEVRVDVPGLLSRALIASASGNYAKALSLFDEILEVEPSNVNALIGKAVAYRRRGNSPREHPPRARRGGGRPRIVRTAHAALSQRRGSVDRPGGRPPENRARRRGAARVHAGAHAEPRRRRDPTTAPRARGGEGRRLGDPPRAHLRERDRPGASQGIDRRGLQESGGLREGDPEVPHGGEGRHTQGCRRIAGAFPRDDGASPVTRASS